MTMSFEIIYNNTRWSICNCWDALHESGVSLDLDAHPLWHLSAIGWVRRLVLALVGSLTWKVLQAGCCLAPSANPFLSSTGRMAQVIRHLLHNNLLKAWQTMMTHWSAYPTEARFAIWMCLGFGVVSNEPAVKS